MKEYIIKIDESRTDIMGATYLLEQPKELIRCKDCRDYMTAYCVCDDCCVSDDWFCPAGKRREMK